MMRRIGFRRLLPLSLTVLHLLLILYTVTQDRTVSGIRNESGYHTIVYQEDSEVRWEPGIERKLTAVQKIALVVNLPALLVAIPFSEAFFRGNENALLYASTAFVPLLWYGVGRWLDGALGYIVRSHGIPRLWSALLAVLSTSLLCLSVLSFTPFFHHRTADTYQVGAASVLWSGLFLAISVSSFRRRTSG